MDDNRFECKLSDWCRDNIKPCPFIDQAACGFYAGANTSEEIRDRYKDELLSNYQAYKARYGENNG